MHYLGHFTQMVCLLALTSCTESGWESGGRELSSCEQEATTICQREGEGNKSEQLLLLHLQYAYLFQGHVLLLPQLVVQLCLPNGAQLKYALHISHVGLRLIADPISRNNKERATKRQDSR